MTAAAEPVRRGGGTGLVVEPADCRVVLRWGRAVEDPRAEDDHRSLLRRGSPPRERRPPRSPALARPQARRQVALEQLEEPALVVARARGRRGG